MNEFICGSHLLLLSVFKIGENMNTYSARAL